MREIVLHILFVFSFCAVFGANTEPTANEFEANVFARVSKSENDAEKLKIFSEALKDNRAGAALFFNAANFYAQKSDFPTSERLYKKALSVMPNFYLAHRNLAYLHYNNSNHREALANFASALALSGEDSAKIFKAYAFSLMELGAFDESLTALEKALMYAPDDENLLRAKARCLYETGQTSRFCKYAESLLVRYPKEPLYWRMLARLDVDSGDYLGASASLESMRLLGISESDDMELLGDVYARLGLYEKAHHAYDSLVMSPKKNYEIARYFALSGAEGEALKTLSRLDKNSAEYLEVSAILQNTSEAFKKAYDKNPSSAYLSLKMADFYLEEKCFELAKSFYRQAEKAEPLRAFFGVANTLICEGEYAEAVLVLKEISRRFNRTDLDEYILKLEEYASRK